MTRDWESRVAAVWDTAADRDEDDVVAAISALVAERPDGDPAGLFEQASVYDYAGREDDAAPLYERALASGLDSERRPRAIVQLASTWRNLGRSEESIDLLSRELAAGPDSAVADWMRAFLALCLISAGRPVEATAVALEALAPHLTMYERSIRFYVGELSNSA